MPTLGDVIRTLRESSGLSRNALARAAKIDPAILTRLEQNERDTVRVTTLCRIAEALDVSLDDLASAAGFFSKRRGRPMVSQGRSIVLREALERIQRLTSDALREPKKK